MLRVSRFVSGAIMAAASGSAMLGGCSLSPWRDDEPPPPAWAGKAPREQLIERDAGLITNQKTVEPEESAVLDQLSDAEEIQKNVAVERVEGEDPCLNPEAQGVSCGRELEGRRAQDSRGILPEVSLQMLRSGQSEAFDPARAVDGIGRAEQRYNQDQLAIGDRYLNSDRPDAVSREPVQPDVAVEGILIDPSIVGGLPN